MVKIVFIPIMLIEFKKNMLIKNKKIYKPLKVGMKCYLRRYKKEIKETLNQQHANYHIGIIEL